MCRTPRMGLSRGNVSRKRIHSAEITFAIKCHWVSLLLLPLLKYFRACIELSSESGIIYFPIGYVEPTLLTNFNSLFENWEEATISNTWTSEEKGLMIFCIFMYLIVMLWAGANLGFRLYKDRLNSLPPNSEVSLLCIVLLSSRKFPCLGLIDSIVGATYLLMVLQGSLRDNHLDPLLLDLPSLCLLTCVTFISKYYQFETNMIVMTWRGIIRSGKSLNVESKKWENFLPFWFLIPLYLVSLDGGEINLFPAVRRFIDSLCGDKGNASVHLRHNASRKGLPHGLRGPDD